MVASNNNKKKTAIGGSEISCNTIHMVKGLSQTNCEITTHHARHGSKVLPLAPVRMSYLVFGHVLQAPQQHAEHGVDARQAPHGRRGQLKRRQLGGVCGRGMQRRHEIGPLVAHCQPWDKKYENTSMSIHGKGPTGNQELVHASKNAHFRLEMACRLSKKKENVAERNLSAQQKNSDPRYKNQITSAMCGILIQG